MWLSGCVRDSIVKNKPVTIKDIAKRLGISYSTVSRALSPHAAHLVKDQTRSIVQQTAHEMDYSPNLMARTLLKGGEGVLGLLTYHLSLESYGRQIHHFLRMAGEQGYQILIAATVDQISRSPEDDQVKQIRQLESRGVDGLLINTRGDEGESARIVKAVKGRFPVETYCYPAGDMNGVAVDHASGFFEMTEHLIGLGHERICFLGEDWVRTNGPSAMGKGYFAAMRKHGLTPRRAAIKSIGSYSGYRLGKELGSRFTALVCCSDNTALGVCRGLSDSGTSVPGDVAVTGFGDMALSAYTTPALTTLSIPYEEIAQLAMRDILRQLRGETTPCRHTLKPRLIVRESCGVK